MLRRLRPIHLAAPVHLALLPTRALASCPRDGPGPDEVLIGMDKSVGCDVPPVTCPGANTSSPLGDRAGGYWVDQYAVLNWGNDANGTPTCTWTVGAD